MATLEQIQAKMKKLQAQAEAMLVAKSQAALNQIRDLMEKHGLTTADIGTHKGGKKRGRKPGAQAAVKAGASVAKYRDPKSGASWTGHGRAPAWIANAKDRSKFLVDGAVAPAVKSQAKVKAVGKGYPRGPQPAKYRDPKSGATWSGRGPAPTWLSSVKDRTKFLIAGADTGAAAVAPVAKKAAVKKAASKKAVVKKAVVKKAAAKKAVAKKATAPAKKASAKPASAPAKKAAAKPAPKKAAAPKKAPVAKNASVAVKAAPVAAEAAAVAAV